MLNFRRLKKLITRGWRIYVWPPRESRVALNVDDLPILARRMASHQTASQPKQVAIASQKKLAFVSCMKGKKLQIFDYSSGLSLVDEIEFPDQCVEVTVCGDLCFVTSTNFARDADAVRGVHKRNFLTIISIDSGKILSTIDTGGNWSKVVKIHPNRKLALVSNWHTHDVSVIDIQDPSSPQLKQRLTCGESPRGIAFTESGEGVLVTGFYSGNIIELRQSTEGRFHVEHVGQRFNTPHYSGNLRDILIDQENEDLAWISNMGRNLVHQYSLREREFVASFLVGKSPNSLNFLEMDGLKLLVSCRGANVVLILDTKTRTVKGRSEFTGKSPTGLAAIPRGFLLSGFASHTLELYRF